MVTAEDGVTAITYEVKIASSPAPLDGNACLSDITFTWKHLIKNIFAFSRQNWFIQCYLFLMLLYLEK